MRVIRRFAPARLVPALLFMPVAALAAGWFCSGAAGFGPAVAQAAPPAGEETRAIWVVRHSITTPGRVDKVVEIAQELNVNTLLAQVRGRGDAYYKSDVAPQGEAMGTAPEGFDPLDHLIRRAHAADLEVHAWINVYLVWSAGNLPVAPTHVVNAHPDWIGMRADGTRLVSMMPVGSDQEELTGMYLSPGNPEVKRHLREVVREIVSKYDVDGIHLDYVRYPEPYVGYDDATRTAFARDLGVDPMAVDEPDSLTLAVIGADRMSDLRARWIQWRRDQVTDFVRTVRHDLDLVGRPVKLTAAVIADQITAMNRHLQDWPRWLREGIVDAVVPMVYTPSTPIASRQISAALEIPTGRQVWAGLAVYNQSARSAAEKARRARELGVDGIALFSYDTLLESAGYRRSLRTWLFSDATVPTDMSWRRD